MELGGETAGTRTQDPRLKRPLLYQLSYRPRMQGVISDYQRLAPKLRAATLCGRDFNRTDAEQRRDATAH